VVLGVLGEALAMLTQEDIETLHEAINSLTFVRSGLTENDSEQRDLLNQSLIPLRMLILQQKS
jgi:hypothetical protein